ncbi:unnamed protein product [Effrenium voratum]|uniref:Purine nucleoside permease n=1 Tax=Effrenium voratum TaxID=2562239 RepID=A0AA36MYV9_9DINO|nr:unnamed protein product [Effrenium voratum]CAJ1447219.1 unnamed protein product [Effrenium voratum]
MRAATLLWLLQLGCADLVPRVVIVTTFPPEFARWKRLLPLDEELPFPGGGGSTSLWWNSELHVLGMVTGMTSKNAAMSVTALGHDQRFDLKKAVWLLAGIAGADPEAGTVGGAVWARSLVDGTAVKFLDPREMPPAWPTGWLPQHRAAPYGQPLPSEAERQQMVVSLNPRLVQWAYKLTQSIQLPDSEALQHLREQYHHLPAAQSAPAISLGATLSTDVFWTGSFSASWARNWTTYWAGGRGTEGVPQFAASAMEDFATAQALAALQRLGRSRGPEALLVLRSTSNFVEPPPGRSPEPNMDFFLEVACEAAFLVGEPVVKALVRNADDVQDVLYG